MNTHTPGYVQPHATESGLAAAPVALGVQVDHVRRHGTDPLSRYTPRCKLRGQNRDTAPLAGRGRALKRRGERNVNRIGGGVRLLPWPSWAKPPLKWAKRWAKLARFAIRRVSSCVVFSGNSRVVIRRVAIFRVRIPLGTPYFPAGS